VIETKPLRHFASSSPASINWDYENGNVVDVHFLIDDGSALVVTTTRRMLEMLRDNIDRALSDKPKPTRRP
jgi:hypothetical protein